MNSSSREIHELPRKKAAVGVVVYDNRVLIVLERRDGGAPRWQFPGGSVREGESCADAAVREVAEETGVVCSPSSKIGEHDDNYREYLVSFWACEFCAGTPTLMEPDKFDDVAWVTPRVALARIDPEFFPPVRDFLKAIDCQQ